MNKFLDEIGLKIIWKRIKSILQAGEEYSDEETKIGTWIDGKPLYRICGETVTSSEMNANTIIHPEISDGEVKFFKGIIQASDGIWHDIPTLSGSTGGPIALLNYSPSKGLRVVVGAASLTNRPIIYELKYTKTTDDKESLKKATSELLPKESCVLGKEEIEYDGVDFNGVGSTAKH